MLLVLSGLNACLLNIANFLVTFYTSAITLQVLGNVKNCVAIGVSVLIFHNPLRASQAFGMSVTLFGVWVYNKYGGKVKEPPKEKLERVEEEEPLLEEAQKAEEPLLDE